VRPRLRLRRHQLLPPEFAIAFGHAFDIQGKKKKGGKARRGKGKKKGTSASRTYELQSSFQFLRPFLSPIPFKRERGGEKKVNKKRGGDGSGYPMRVGANTTIDGADQL